MNDLINILVCAGAIGVGLAIGLFVIPGRKIDAESYEQKAQDALKKSHEEIEQIRTKNLEQQRSMEAHAREQEEKSKHQIEVLETLTMGKEEQLQQKEEKIQTQQSLVDTEKAQVDGLQKNIDHLQRQLTVKLSEKTGITIEDAKAEILNEFERDLELQREDRLNKYEEYLKEEKQRLAKNYLTNVIQRYSAPTSVEKKSSSIEVNRDELKGRLIGKNAEHIILIEEATGVDIIFNDAPNTIIISCFDLVKRHIARETIEKLLKEKVITAEKVKQKLADCEAEMERRLIKIGQDTVKMLRLENRNFPPDFMRIIGRLQYRTSYGQNILKHSFEVGYFTLMLGGELGVNTMTSKVGGFFHDLGKAIDHEVGGSHDVLTKEIMEKYTFSEEEIHAAWAHHDAVPQRTPEAFLVKAGDAISAGRPGARQESLEKYIERIQAIEGISNSYEGVHKSFAISAGREVRVIVDPMKIKDYDLKPLAQNIAQEVQENVAYPGKVKINVIRRTKNTDYVNKLLGETTKKK